MEIKQWPQLKSKECHDATYAGLLLHKVDLEAGAATYNENSPVTIEAIKDAISRIGFEVVS